MTISDNGVVTLNENDIIRRQLIMFSRKLLDEKANNWFKEYYGKQQCDNLESVRKPVCDYLIKNFGFKDDELEIMLFNINAISPSADGARYTIVHNVDKKDICFDTYNGYFYTASKQGSEYNLVLFDYGDFYCLVYAFPLAFYFYLLAKEFEKNGTEEEE